MRTRRIWMIAIGSAVAVAVLAVAAKIAYPKIKLARGRQNAAEAMSALRKGDLTVAGAKVNRARHGTEGNGNPPGRGRILPATQ